jgi:Na+/melibiose symporter-like transporter
VKSNNTSKPSFGTADYFKITILFFALTALSQAMHGIILPVRVLDFVAEPQKNTYLGLLTFAGLILAMLIQPVVSAISDRAGFNWGRRRPFILFGILITVLFLSGIGLAGSFAVLFISYLMLQFGNNIAQGPLQAFIPEKVPNAKRGRASGVKGLMEVLGGVALIYFIAIFMDNYAAGEGNLWLWLPIIILGMLLLAFMIATVVLVKETPGLAAPRVSLLASLCHPFKLNLKADRPFLWFMASRLSFFIALAIIQQFALFYLQDVIGVSQPAEAIAQFSILAVVGMLVIVYPAGRLSDRIGRKPVGMVGTFIGAVGFLIIILSHSYTGILVAAGFLGIALGAFTSTNWALATDLVPKGQEGRYLALANVATAGGAALARLMGPVIDYFNNSVSAGLGYQVMLFICLGLILLGGLLLLKVQRPATLNGLENPKSAASS